MCEVFGTATLLMGPPQVWEQTDPEIHLPPELVESSGHLFEEKYVIEEWCEERSAFHARLK